MTLTFQSKSVVTCLLDAATALRRSGVRLLGLPDADRRRRRCGSAGVAAARRPRPQRHRTGRPDGRHRRPSGARPGARPALSRTGPLHLKMMHIGRINEVILGLAHLNRR